MTTIDPKSAQAALFEKLGITKKTEAEKAKSDTPVNQTFEINDHAITKSGSIAPMDNGDFIAKWPILNSDWDPGNEWIIGKLVQSLIKRELLQLLTCLDTLYLSW